MLRHLGEEFLGVGGDLFRSPIVLMRGDGPLMTERIFHLTVAITPKRIGHGHPDLATGRDRAIEQGVGVLDVDMQKNTRAAATFGRETIGRKLVREHERGVADLQLRVHQRLAIGRHHPHHFLRAESFLVKFNGGQAVVDDEVGGQRIESVRNRFGQWSAHGRKLTAYGWLASAENALGASNGRGGFPFAFKQLKVVFGIF